MTLLRTSVATGRKLGKLSNEQEDAGAGKHEPRHDRRGGREVEWKRTLRQRHDRTEQLPQKNARALLEAFLAQVLAEEPEHLRAGAEIGEVENGNGRDQGDREPPVPAFVE